MVEGWKLCITGGAGFIGSHLIERLAAKNRLVVFDNFHRDALTASGLAGHAHIEVVRGDVLDAEALYRGPGAGRFLARTPDYFGAIVAPALTLGTYGLDGFSASFGRPFWGRHADHELLALVEAYAVTLALTQTVKVSVGRERPEYELGRGERPSGDDPERTLSFFSGHSSSSFCLAAFVSRDVGDWLVTYKGAGTFTGRVLPSIVLYGLAGLVGFSRIVDQKHYLTDVAVGAVVGATAGNLFYALHFEADGRPRRRHPGRVNFLAFPGGLMLEKKF